MSEVQNWRINSFKRGDIICIAQFINALHCNERSSKPTHQEGRHHLHCTVYQWQKFKSFFFRLTAKSSCAIVQEVFFSDFIPYNFHHHWRTSFDEVCIKTSSSVCKLWRAAKTDRRFREFFQFSLPPFQSMNIWILFHAGEAGIRFSLQRSGRCQCQGFAIDGQTYFTFQLFKQFQNSQGQIYACFRQQDICLIYKLFQIL